MAFLGVAMNPQRPLSLLQRAPEITATPGCPCACMRGWAKRSWHYECSTATPSVQEGARAGPNLPRRTTSCTPSATPPTSAPTARYAFLSVITATRRRSSTWPGSTWARQSKGVLCCYSVLGPPRQRGDAHVPACAAGQDAAGTASVRRLPAFEKVLEPDPTCRRAQPTWAP